MNPIECSVLIVDDEESDRYFLRRLLKAANIQGEVFEAYNGRHALDFLTNYEESKRMHGKEFPPKAILLDINMPIMNGFEFLQAFTVLSESNVQYRSIVFAMITSSSNEEDYQRAGSFSCVSDYLAKDNLSAEILHELFLNRFQSSI